MTWSSRPGHMTVGRRLDNTVRQHSAIFSTLGGKRGSLTVDVWLPNDFQWHFKDNMLIYQSAKLQKAAFKNTPGRRPLMPPARTRRSITVFLNLQSESVLSK